jgi:hypothetical protein
VSHPNPQKAPAGQGAPPTLADTRHVPTTTAAAVYEANGANSDFMRAWIAEGGTYAGTEWLRSYRAAAESVMDAEFSALAAAVARPRGG